MPVFDIAWKYFDEADDRATVGRYLVPANMTPAAWVARQTVRPEDRKVLVRATRVPDEQVYGSLRTQ